MNVKEATLERIREISKLIAELTGDTEPFAYVSEPGDGQVKVVFQDKVCLGASEGLAYVSSLFADAYLDAAEASKPKPSLQEVKERLDHE